MVKVTTPVSHHEIPPAVQQLLTKREEARTNQDFTQSDRLRQEIQQLGYEVNDNPGGYQLSKSGDSDKKPAKHFLLLFGSGEIAPSSVDIYRQVFLQLGKRDLRIALVTTPALFQPNVELVYGEIKEFFLSSFPDFNLAINLVSSAKEFDPADIIFMGPGSPTYAVRQLRNNPLLTKIIDQVKNGSTLILASAATLACSRHCLPVYEIYKVGEDLHWVDGLNLYREIWQEVSVIPHFNNREGGVGLDTTHCFIGQTRFDKLRSLLPRDTKFLGLDEHTALIIDLSDQTEQILGKGKVHQIQ